MKYRRLDENGDYNFGHGEQDFLLDIDAVAQAIKTRLLFFQEEWWEDLTAGIPMFQSILGQAGTPENKDAVDMLVRAEILGTPNVTSISDLVSTIEQRIYTFQAQVQTVYGAVELEVSF